MLRNICLEGPVFRSRPTGGYLSVSIGHRTFLGIPLNKFPSSEVLKLRELQVPRFQNN